MPFYPKDDKSLSGGSLFDERLLASSSQRSALGVVRLAFAQQLCELRRLGVRPYVRRLVR